MGSIFSRGRHILHENFCCNRSFPVTWWRNLIIWFNLWKPKAIHKWTKSGKIRWITSLDCFMMLLYMMMFICLVKSKCPHTVCIYAWKLMGEVRAVYRAFTLMANTVSMLEKYHEKWHSRLLYLRNPWTLCEILSNGAFTIRRQPDASYS